MLMKIITTLFIVGLLSQSTTADIKISNGLTQEGGIRDCINSMPGFNYEQGIFKMFQMGAQDGCLQGYETMKNITAWQPSFNEANSSISQLVQMPMSVTYNETTTRLGRMKALGKLGVDLSGSTVQLIMTATASDNGTCMLNITAILTELGVPFLDTSSLNLVGLLLQAVLGALSGIINTLVGVLSNVLPDVLPPLLVEQIKNRLDLNTTCTLLLASNPSNYLEPNLNM